MKKLRIAIVSQQFGKTISGIGTHTRLLVEYLRRDGHEITLIIPSDQIFDNYPDIKIIKVHPSPFNSHIRWLPLSYYFSKSIKEFLSHESLDIIHYTDAREALFSKFTIPQVGNVNDTYLSDIQPLKYYRQYYKDGFSRWLYYRLARKLELSSYQKIDQIIANSAHTAQNIKTAYNLPTGKINICYKAIDTQRILQYLSEAKSYRTNSKILFVGNNFQRKGLPILIAASVPVLRNFPNVEFLIVGKDKSQQEMEKICEKLVVTKSFRFLGLKSQLELLEIYIQSDIFVMPSLTEAFGVVFLEAMMCGLVVIGSKVGGIPELIQHGFNGLLVPPNCPAKLAEEIMNLLRNRQLAKKYSINGIETAKKFSPERMIECTYKVYEKALKN